MKLCRDCKHYRPYKDFSALDACVHPYLPEKVDPVRGEPLDHYCSDVRMSSSKCGPDGLLWEAK